MEKLFKGEVPAGEAIKQARARHEIASRGGAYARPQDRPPISAKVAAARDTDQLIKDTVKKAIPDVRKANETYRVTKRVVEQLEKTVGKEVSSGAKDSFVRNMMGKWHTRMAITSAVGATGFGHPGVGAAIFATDLGLEALRKMSKTGFWNSLSAQTKRGLAKAIRTGDHVAAQGILQQAIAVNPEEKEK